MWVMWTSLITPLPSLELLNLIKENNSDKNTPVKGCFYTVRCCNVWSSIKIRPVLQALYYFICDSWNLPIFSVRIASMDEKTLWDVIVVGGGPAGMMAAGTAAEKGAKVLLIEKNEILGKKLLITGGGRCNITNSELNNRKLLEKFKDDGKFLFSAFSQWSVKETLDFFHARGMDTKVEKELRVFPVSDSARSVLDVLAENMRKHNVKVLPNSPVLGMACEGGCANRSKIEE